MTRRTVTAPKAEARPQAEAGPTEVQRAADGPATDYVRAGDLLRALAAPLRIAIVIELDNAGSRCVHELVDALDAPQPLVSQHLRVLRAAGIVDAARRGREVAYALADAHIAHIVRDAVAHSTHTRAQIGTGSASPGIAST